MAGNARTHVLITLGVLFTIGGITRILPQTRAVAEENASEVAEPATPATARDAASETKPAAPKPAAQTTSAAPDEICLTGEAASALASDQAALKERTAALQQREIDIRAREAELKRQADELAALQQAVEERWDTMTVSAGADIEHLTQMYSVMKPDQAAGIFNQMDPAFAAGFLRLMQSDQAGLILASMQPDKAYVVSVKMANKNSDVRSAAEMP